MHSIIVVAFPIMCVTLQINIYCMYLSTIPSKPSNYTIQSENVVGIILEHNLELVYNNIILLQNNTTIII